MSFRPIERQTDFLLPPSVQDWLPESHLARYVVDVVESLALSELANAYAGRGSDAYHPATLLSLLIYGYVNRPAFELHDRSATQGRGAGASQRAEPVWAVTG